MKIYGNINLNNKNIYIWRVWGAEGHRLKNSFHESYVMSMEGCEYDRPIVISELNSDVTGSDLYNIFIVFAPNEELAENEFNGQLTDGSYECTRTGKTERIL